MERTTPTPPDRRTVAHSALTPEQRSARARMGAMARWSRQDGHAGTQPARSAFLARFERQVDPEGQLAPDERAKRAQLAMREHMQRLAWKRHSSTRAAS